MTSQEEGVDWGGELRFTEENRLDGARYLENMGRGKGKGRGGGKWRSEVGETTLKQAKTILYDSQIMPYRV